MKDAATARGAKAHLDCSSAARRLLWKTDDRHFIGTRSVVKRQVIVCWQVIVEACSYPSGSPGKRSERVLGMGRLSAAW